MCPPESASAAVSGRILMHTCMQPLASAVVLDRAGWGLSWLGSFLHGCRSYAACLGCGVETQLQEGQVGLEGGHSHTSTSMSQTQAAMQQGTRAVLLRQRRRLLCVLATSRLVRTSC